VGLIGEAACQLQLITARPVAGFLAETQVMLWISSLGTILASAGSVVNVTGAETREPKPLASNP